MIATIGLVINIVSLVVGLAIILLLVTATYGGVQQKARNTKRQVDVQSMQTQLESFYSDKGHYPSLADINSASWRSTNLNGLDSNALEDPSSPSVSKLASSPTPKQYSYQVTDSQGASCENDDTKCAQYTLTATYEGTENGQKTITADSLTKSDPNNSDPATLK